MDTTELVMSYILLAVCAGLLFLGGAFLWAMGPSPTRGEEPPIRREQE